MCLPLMFLPNNGESLNCRHLFAIGSAAYSKMIKDSENQVIVIRYVKCCIIRESVLSREKYINNFLPVDCG